MSLDKILSIAGKPGLYRLITQTRAGFIAESLIDKKRLSVNISQNVSILSEIAIYTLATEVPLKDVLKAMKDKENGEQASVKPKDNKTKLEAYFAGILEDYDSDRVYASDIKKVVQWYNLLQQHNMLGFLDSEDSKEKALVEEE